MKYKTRKFKYLGILTEEQYYKDMVFRRDWKDEDAKKMCKKIFTVGGVTRDKITSIIDSIKWTWFLFTSLFRKTF